MALPERMKFGIFMAPFHPLGEDPTLALDRDLELIQWLDHLGFDEAWVGEHHSAGWETIASPELFIATAAERTRHIKLGTGVVSLPYHHPLMVVNRMVLLDHLTKGRAMLGVGPGALGSDAYMLGIDALAQRHDERRLHEHLPADLPEQRLRGARHAPRRPEGVRRGEPDLSPGDRLPGPDGRRRGRGRDRLRGRRQCGADGRLRAAHLAAVSHARIAAATASRTPGSAA